MTWDPQRARETYNIPHWSGGYFDVDPDGRLVARPSRNPRGPGIDLYALAQEVRDAGLSLPVLVRFTDILRNRLDALCEAFEQARSATAYKGGYTAVYPIKVNQQASVVETLVQHGGDRFGLEAGSKPELMVVLALAPADGIIVCNGYKDREYIRLALIGERLGHRVYIVVEKPSELELVIEEAQRLNVRPRIGLRVRLASAGAGKWQGSGGDKSKFGLNAEAVLAAVERLRGASMIGSLELLHFHLGSQIPNIQVIQNGMRECARHYVELQRLGTNIRFLDVGGGLGVDYEGTRSRSFCSANYTLEDYAHAVVQTLAETCAREHLPAPNIISESGRALTAHHAVLLVNVIDSDHAPPPGRAERPATGSPQVLRDLWHALEEIDRNSPLETYHNAGEWLRDVQLHYSHGLLSLQERAAAERLHAVICHRLRERLQPGVRAHREVLDELNERLADKYFCNFSLFQSLPDAWAIDQVFPVMPLHRLDEEPTRRVMLEDITCDSDGRIDHYVDGEGIETTLPLHDCRGAEPYLLGIFLLGAYQEILGDMHNLFGDTDSVNVELNPDGSHRLVGAARGDSVADLLRYVKFTPEQLLGRYESKIGGASLTADEQTSFLGELREGLDGYTYLEE